MYFIHGFSKESVLAAYHQIDIPEQKTRNINNKNEHLYITILNFIQVI